MLTLWMKMIEVMRMKYLISMLSTFLAKIGHLKSIPLQDLKISIILIETPTSSSSTLRYNNMPSLVIWLRK
jgi:hypothetical protein